MNAKATSVRNHRQGKAYWYAIAETSAGQMFLKIPLIEKGGAEGPWREFIAMRLANALGLPTLQPCGVEVDPEILSAADRERTLWRLGNRFIGTPFQQNLRRGRGYEELTISQKALLYAFDNLLYYTDRARPSVEGRQDCWLGDNNKPLLFDWDLYPAPSQEGRGNAIDSFSWDHCGAFLAQQLRRHQVEEACRTVAAVADEVVSGVIAQAVNIWPHMNGEAVSSWLIGRRDGLVHAAQHATNPPWLP